MNLHPLVTVLLVELHQLDVLGHGPFLLVEIWVHIVVPSLTALFPNTSWQESRNLLPLLEPEEVYLFLEYLVLLIGPISLHSF